MAAPLWVAFGCPAAEAPLPAARTEIWRRCRHTLLELLRPLRPRLSGPRALWTLVHGSAAPRAATWGQLCRGITVDTLRAACERPVRKQQLGTWNLRWLISPFTYSAARKRAKIIEACSVRKAVLCVQETHWSPADADIWEASAGVTVVSAAARPGPRGGTQGGVAIFIPADLGPPRDPAVGAQLCCRRHPPHDRRGRGGHVCSRQSLPPA